MPHRQRLAVLALLIAGPLAAQPQPALDQIGSWLLTCPADMKSEPCRMRHQAWVLPPGSGHPSAALEVLRRRDLLIPAIAMRGLTMQAALGGMLALKASVSLRFDAGQPVDLVCGLDGAAVVCAPEGTQAASAGSQLAAAHSVLVQMQLSLPGVIALPEQSRALDLQRTSEALARFRATAPAGEALPAIPGLDWHGFLDRLMRDAGFEHGLSDLAPTIGGWFGGRRP